MSASMHVARLEKTTRRLLQLLNYTCLQKSIRHNQYRLRTSAASNVFAMHAVSHRARGGSHVIARLKVDPKDHASERLMSAHVSTQHTRLQSIKR
eukprot:2686930-Pleurochrysis_carterae.AAC.1